MAKIKLTIQIDMKTTSPNKPKNFTLILYKRGSQRTQVAERLETKSKRRFLRKLRLLPNKFDAYLRVSYGDGFWNDGYYQDKKYLMFVFEAFTER